MPIPNRLSNIRGGGNETISVDPILTELARGYVNSEFIGDNLFPSKTVQTESFQVPVYGLEQFAVRNTKRAIRASSNRSELQGFRLEQFRLDEHDHEYLLDYREVHESKNSPLLPNDLERHATIVNEEIMRLGREKAQADLAQNPDTYLSSHVRSLGSGEKFNDPTSDPIAILEESIAIFKSKHGGKKPNRLIFGDSVWSGLKHHPKILDRIKYAQVGVLSYELFASILDLDAKGIFVGTGTYVLQAQLKKNGDDSGVTMQNLWGNNVIMAFVEPNPASMYSMSFGFTFDRAGGKFVDTYHPGDDQKLTAIRNTAIYRPHVMMKSAGYLLRNVI